MDKKNLAQFSLSLVLILLLSSGLIFVGHDINGRVANIENIKRIISVHINSVKNLSIMKSDLNLIQPYVSSIDDLIVNHDQLLNVLSDINSIASQLKISANPTFLEEQSKSAGLNSIGIAFNGNVNQFDNLIQFLKYLEKGKYYFQFNSLDLNGSNNYSFAINSRVFYINQ